MCEPVSLIAGGLAIAGAVSSAAAQQEAHNSALGGMYSQQAYRNRLAAWQRDREIKQKASIEVSARDQTAAIIESSDQIRNQTFQAIEGASRSARAASANIAASRDQMTGNSVALLQQQAEKAEAEYTNIMWQNFKGKMNQANRQIRAIDARARSQFEAATPGPMGPLNANIPAPPSGLGLALNIGAAGVNAYAQGLQNNANSAISGVNNQTAAQTSAQVGGQDINLANVWSGNATFSDFFNQGQQGNNQ